MKERYFWYAGERVEYCSRCWLQVDGCTCDPKPSREPTGTLTVTSRSHAKITLLDGEGSK